MERYHFIGIKGAGMSALAQLLHDKGHDVQGSDVEEELFTQVELEKRGIPLLPFSGSHITGDRTVIIGNAFKDTHEEVEKATRMGVERYRYHEFLARFMAPYRSIAVTGTHGKTSTTSLLSHVLGSEKPTHVLIGDGTGSGVDEASHFVFESCEYRRHFLAYHPTCSIITNIEHDHPDYFRDVEDVLEAFGSMGNQTGEQLVVCGDDPGVRNLRTSTPVITYGLSEGCDVRAVSIETTTEKTAFVVRFPDGTEEAYWIPQHGTHTIQNALAVIIVCRQEGLEKEAIQEALGTFNGAKRRFSVEAIGDTIVVDDYAHHPTEIAATIETARLKYPGRHIIAIFQPHTYTRTATFLSEFKEALGQADVVFGCPIFGSAREKKGTLTIEDLTSRVLTLETISELSPYEGSVLLFMGAGDIGTYIDAYKETMNNQVR